MSSPRWPKARPSKSTTRSTGTWPGREPDQAPQIVARQRPHLVPLGQCQPDVPHPPHRH
jgi:hypothetical protein